MTSAVTLAPSTVGVPTLTSLEPSNRTGSSTVAPASASSFSSRSTSPSATRYCLPPDSTIANIDNLRECAPGPGAETPKEKYTPNGQACTSACMGSGHLRREAPLVSVRGWGLVVEGLVGS